MKKRVACTHCHRTVKERDLHFGMCSKCYWTYDEICDDLFLEHSEGRISLEEYNKQYAALEKKYRNITTSRNGFREVYP